MKKSVVSRNRLLTGTYFLFAILVILNSCTKSSTSDTASKPGANEVWIQGMAYIPSTITVNAGTTITWTNKDGVDHTVTSNTGVFDSGSLNTNGTFSHLFNTAGTFPYHCTIHPTITGTVIVN